MTPDPLDSLTTLTDEYGNVIPFQELMRLKVHGKLYSILEDPADPDTVMIYYVWLEPDDTESLVPVEDEDEIEDIFYYYMAESEEYEYGPAE